MKNFLKNFNEPKYVVCDGKNGLIKAIKSVWFNIKIQRCLFHVWMNVRQKLALNSETQAGQELLCLSRELLKINLLNMQIIDNLNSKFERINIMNLLVKKSVNPETGKIWFTQARLRSVAFNLGKLIPNKTLFNFLDNCEVKSMNNVLDGVINPPYKTLVKLP